MSFAFDPGDADVPHHDDHQPATKGDLARLERGLRVEMRAVVAELRAELIDKLDNRTTALMLSQIGSIIAVAAIAFAN